ncbi:hypothetical protein OAX78_02825 [Planctomycetota bacterium]|nr:hypothetical protein [Planctomycetota bacterium]
MHRSALLSVFLFALLGPPALAHPWDELGEHYEALPRATYAIRVTDTISILSKPDVTQRSYTVSFERGVGVRVEGEVAMGSHTLILATPETLSVCDAHALEAAHRCVLREQPFDMVELVAELEDELVLPLLLNVSRLDAPMGLGMFRWAETERGWHGTFGNEKEPMLQLDLVCGDEGQLVSYETQALNGATSASFRIHNFQVADAPLEASVFARPEVEDRLLSWGDLVAAYASVDRVQYRVRETESTLDPEYGKEPFVDAQDGAWITFERGRGFRAVAPNLAVITSDWETTHHCSPGFMSLRQANWTRPLPAHDCTPRSRPHDSPGFMDSLAIYVDDMVLPLLLGRQASDVGWTFATWRPAGENAWEAVIPDGDGERQLIFLNEEGQIERLRKIEDLGEGMITTKDYTLQFVEEPEPFDDALFQIDPAMHRESE